MSTQQYFYDRQIRRYIQQFIRLFSGFSVQMGKDEQRLPIYQQVPVRYGDISRMAAHIQRENSENIVNTVPFISCYVNSLDMMAERRVYPQFNDKVQVFEKAVDPSTNEYINEVGNTYTIERHQPVPYKLTMNCDVWTSNTEQKLQLLEQILVLFNPTLNIRTTDNPFDWTGLSMVEMTNIVWSSRSVGSSIDDIIDVASLTFDVPVLVNPPARVKQQKLIYNIINELYTLDDDNLSAFESNEPFDQSSLQYTIVTFEDRKTKFINNTLYLLNNEGNPIDENGNKLEWAVDLEKFGKLRPGISQVRLRKSNDPGDTSNDIVGRLFESTDPNALLVEIDVDTLPQNTVAPVDGIVNPTANYPGDGIVPTASIGQRYIIIDDIQNNNTWGTLVAHSGDIIQFNGSVWTVVFDSTVTTTQEYLTNTATSDQLEWNGTDWFNSYEGIYNPAFWRLYL